MNESSGCLFFRDVVSALQREDLVQRSPRGQKLHHLLSHIMNMDDTVVDDVSIRLTSAVSGCVTASKKQKLPSTACAALWSAFHRMRTSKHVEQIWSCLMGHIPDELHIENRLALQLILDRVMKKLLENEAKTDQQDSPSHIQLLKQHETNAIRYMAGYVAVKLLKNNRKSARNPLLQLKRELFSKVLSRMKAVEQPGMPDSLAEYSSQWSKLIDRGGLYHINNDVFKLFVDIELIVRRHLDIRTCTPDTSIQALIRCQVVASKPILTRWEDIIATDIPSKYEKYSIELLEKIVFLWVTIRGYSFAKGWTMKFERKYKKGTRKSLQPEKEA